MKKLSYRLYFIFSLACLCLVNNLAYAKKCTGQFVNPINDINWECLFPITVGSQELVSNKTGLKDTRNPDLPVCVCPKGGIPLPGIVGGFWEPARLVDISPEPYCFVNLGGLEMDMGFERSQAGRPKAASSQISTWYVHYYMYPILAILELFTDFICLQETNFDPLWISEIDPTGSDDELTMILHPEAFIFNNLLAQAACSADCVAATSNNQPLDSLFWCAGCQGSMYPMNGNVNAHIGGVQASLNAAEKMTFKLHRQSMAYETSSSDIKKLCTKQLALVMKKSHYRYQMVNPDTSKCAPFGKSTSFFESKKETPIIGEDFGFLLWRKRGCCIL